MNSVSPKIVLDKKGAPVEAILPWKVFCEIAEVCGWDLDEKTKNRLRGVRADLENGREDKFVALD
jgi:hypothetical protein